MQQNLCYSRVKQKQNLIVRFQAFPLVSPAGNSFLFQLYSFDLFIFANASAISL